MPRRTPEGQDTGGPVLDCGKSTGVGLGDGSSSSLPAQYPWSSHLTSEDVDSNCKDAHERSPCPGRHH